MDAFLGKKGGTSPTLKQVIADVQKADTCIRNVNGGWGRTYVEKEMICAGSLQAKESTCQVRRRSLLQDKEMRRISKYSFLGRLWRWPSLRK